MAATAIHRIRSWACVAVGLVVLAACASGGAGESPTDTVPSKGAPKNKCISVVSGERPAAGVTIPRCTTVTTIKP